ncbi:hypothetical protein H6P81_018075 [Aristolochia fimbriata]|uniref:Uncharacterized protein n=1 Tax=Aristolochia fimbriata TaxID=158543 RepID=A0AAV7E1G8_ARIFI|nr:hypothetical protein H6P81_018075 [Aristolochia fimbriata]
MEREENLVPAFSFFGKEASGYIIIDELQEACKKFGLSDLHLDKMIREIDQDNQCYFSLITVQERQIDYNEFAAIMRNGTGGGVERRMMKTVSDSTWMTLYGGKKKTLTIETDASRTAETLTIKTAQH